MDFFLVNNGLEVFKLIETANHYKDKVLEKIIIQMVKCDIQIMYFFIFFLIS